MHFDLKKPCSDCPFRTDSTVGWLGEKRAEEIIDALFKKDQTFSCHKTVDYENEDWDEETGERIYQNRAHEQHCAGAMILMEKTETANQMMRIAERLGIYDRHKLRMKEPVFDTAEQFVEHHTH